MYTFGNVVLCMAYLVDLATLFSKPKPLPISKRQWNVTFEHISHTHRCVPIIACENMHVVGSGGWERLTVSSRDLASLTTFNQAFCKQFNYFIVL